MLLFSAVELDGCIKRFQNSLQSSPFLSCSFMESAFLFCVSPGSGQRDGCRVMSVIALILPFSQHFNLFMLLPNLYWPIICILYMITFPLPRVWAIMGLVFSCCFVQYLLLLPLVNNNMKARTFAEKHKCVLGVCRSYIYLPKSLKQSRHGLGPFKAGIEIQTPCGCALKLTKEDQIVWPVFNCYYYMYLGNTQLD